MFSIDAALFLKWCNKSNGLTLSTFQMHKSATVIVPSPVTSHHPGQPAFLCFTHCHLLTVELSRYMEKRIAILYYCYTECFVADVRKRVVTTTSTPQPRVVGGMGVRPQGLPHQTPIFTPRPLMTAQATPMKPGELFGHSTLH